MSEHDDFITIYESISGWTVVKMWWNKKHGGFWEPWNTGYCKYGTCEEAMTEAREWAESEGIEFKEPTTKTNAAKKEA